MEAMTHEFEIAGMKYVLRAEAGGEVVFWAKPKPTRKGRLAHKWWLGHEESDGTEDLGSMGYSAFRVLRHVKSQVIGWAKKEKPYQFYFSATTDKKRRLYGWLAKKLAKELGASYEHYSFGGTYYFIKQAPA